MAKKEPSYDEAYRELIEIMDALNDEELSIDSLSEKVKRAAALITICRSKLTDTETKISKILED